MNLYRKATSDSGPIRIGVIGAGNIARRIIAGIESGQAGKCSVCAVLARHQKDRPEILAPITCAPQVFLKSAPDLIIEAAGPDALREHAIAALTLTDVWSISGMALGDPVFSAAVEEVGRSTGNRLRLVGGAIAGLDAVTVGSVDPDARIRLCCANDMVTREMLPHFTGTARRAVKEVRGTNVAAAVALAGKGFDATEIVHFRAEADSHLVFTINVDSSIGSYRIVCSPSDTSQARAARTVAASMIAALLQVQKTIWAG